VITDVVLPNMDPLGAGCESYIDTIINDQWDAMLLCDDMKCPRNTYQLSSLASFVTELDDSHAYIVVSCLIIEQGKGFVYLP
jgi:hypothetical protein